MKSLKKNFVIEWKGPFYDVDKLKDEDFQNSFYLISGLIKSQRGESRVQYCGISHSRSVCSRLHDKKHTQEKVTRNKQIWIGKFSDDKLNTKANIELAEHLIVYYCKPELNKKKTKTIPKEPISIINRWKKPSGEFWRRKQYPVQQHINSVVLYDGESFWYAEKFNKI
ncbi:MAG: hypothetical protein EOM29_05715 [Bacteroidia bacterium]|jgi:hypothetical protein|nr:hypothetical protein [Bacteroidales bacterium]NCC18420.1 hypothetical protein [Bacteroidia bacterium]